MTYTDWKVESVEVTPYDTECQVLSTSGVLSVTSGLYDGRRIGCTLWFGNHFSEEDKQKDGSTKTVRWEEVTFGSGNFLTYRRPLCTYISTASVIKLLK